MDQDIQDVVQEKHVEDIVLVRHGVTPENKVDRLGRHLPSYVELMKTGGLPDHEVPLYKDPDSEKAKYPDRNGFMQAQNAGEFLRDHHELVGDFNAFFDSGYLRSIQTLDEILDKIGEKDGKKTKKRRSHPDLREREPGYTFNMTITEINRYFPWYQEYEKNLGAFYQVPPGGESIANVSLRVHMFLNSLRHARQTQGRKSVLIVTHGRVMLCFRFWLEKFLASQVHRLFDQEEKIGNCEILHYKWNESDHRYGKFRYIWCAKRNEYCEKRYEWNEDKHLFLCTNPEECDCKELKP